MFHYTVSLDFDRGTIQAGCFWCSSQAVGAIHPDDPDVMLNISVQHPASEGRGL